MTPHLIPGALLRSIAAGAGGPAAIAALTEIQSSRNRLLTRAVADLATEAGHPGAAVARHAYHVLAEIESVAPAVVSAVLRYPTVGLWLRATVAGFRQPGRRLGSRPRPGRLAAVAAAAAVRAGVAACFPAGAMAAGPVVILPSVGRAFLPGTGEPFAVRPGPDGIILARGRCRAAGWTAPPRLTTGRHDLRLDVPIDGVGWRFVPGGGPERRVLTAARSIEPRVWRRRITDGFRLLSAHHPIVAAETARAVSALVPLRSPAGVAVSGTFRDAFGAVALSLPENARSAALTLAHEVQHTKLIGVADALPLTVPDGNALFYAPWRDDPRPVGALLHGTYAHLGIAAFWQRQRLVEPTEEDTLAGHVAFARWRAAAWGATDVVRSTGRLTEAGELIVAGMRDALRELLELPVPGEAQRRADELADRHRRLRA